MSQILIIECRKIVTDQGKSPRYSFLFSDAIKHCRNLFSIYSDVQLEGAILSDTDDDAERTLRTKSNNDYFSSYKSTAL